MGLVTISRTGRTSVFKRAYLPATIMSRESAFSLSGMSSSVGSRSQPKTSFSFGVICRILLAWSKVEIFRRSPHLLPLSQRMLGPRHEVKHILRTTDPHQNPQSPYNMCDEGQRGHTLVQHVNQAILFPLL